MKQFIRCVCVVLVCSMILAVPVSAAETANQRASDYFMAYSTYFQPVSGSSYQIWFEVTATGMMDELGVKTITVKRSADDINWSTVKTFNMSNYSQMVNKNGAVLHTGYVPYTCTTGYYYVAYVELYAKDGDVTATKTVWTTTLDLT